MATLCRTCFELTDATAKPASCPTCGGRSIAVHDELTSLAIAHIDCDAFYAAIEKRDRPELRDKPLIIGGGRRGVVSTACYIARAYGIHSAQPMFKALKACPHATVIPPDMEKYSAVGRQIRALMEELTPIVEPLSIDEAFLDLTGTERLHKRSPAESLARLARRIESEIGITVSVGLSHCKFLAKVASDLDKPKGFSVIGAAETIDFLKDKPVSLIWGVGKQFQKKLARDGIRSIGQFQTMSERTLATRYGEMGSRLYRLSRGLDPRPVKIDREMKSVSTERTFFDDLSSPENLKAELWEIAESLSTRARKKEIAGRTLTLKLKTRDFKILTRSLSLDRPIYLADDLFELAVGLLEPEIARGPFRLLGIGLSALRSRHDAPETDLFESGTAKRAQIGDAIAHIRDKYGRASIQKGRSFAKKRRGQQEEPDKGSNRSSSARTEKSSV